MHSFPYRPPSYLSSHYLFLFIRGKPMSELFFTFSDCQPKQLIASQLPFDILWVSYSLSIRVEKPLIVTVGRLGCFEFAPGNYIYSGSARRNLLARVNRHLRKEKKLRWHIDYLLNAPTVEIVKVLISTIPECDLVAAGGGSIIVPGFGASDCRSGCGSHLRIL